MNNQTILCVLGVETPDTEVMTVISSAARQNVHIVFLVLSLAPSYPITAYGALPYGAMDFPNTWVEDLTASKRLLEIQSEHLKKLLEVEGVPGEVHPVQTVPIDTRDEVASRALLCDAATILPSLRNGSPELFRAAVIGILYGSPVGLHLNGSPIEKPERVLVAWNSELPAARAIHTALPLLRRASEVQIACFDLPADSLQDGGEPGADLARWLSHHGCKATINQYPTGGIEIADAIQRRAVEFGADLVVMGAYGHSRLREFVFGGTTRAMLEQTEIPVLMAH